MSSVCLRDVCPRDGLQDLSEFVPTDVKVELISRLELAGLTAIEVTSFVSPKVIPQLADAEAVVSNLHPRSEQNIGISAFVANEGGLRRAIAAGLTEVATTVPATDSMSVANFRRTRAEMLSAVEGLRRDAPKIMDMSVTIAVAFGCPFDGPVSSELVLDLVESLVTAGYSTVLFGDTIGVANPHQVSDLVGSAVGRFPNTVFGGHFHDSRGSGIANMVAAVDAGAIVIDASVAGLGGCPFAPGAAGNVATEDAAWLLESLGFDTGVDLAGLVDVARWLRQVVGAPNLSRTPEAVRFEWESDSAARLLG